MSPRTSPRRRRAADPIRDPAPAPEPVQARPDAPEREPSFPSESSSPQPPKAPSPGGLFLYLSFKVYTCISVYPVFYGVFRDGHGTMTEAAGPATPAQYRPEAPPPRPGTTSAEKARISAERIPEGPEDAPRRPQPRRIRDQAAPARTRDLRIRPADRLPAAAHSQPAERLPAADRLPAARPIPPAVSPRPQHARRTYLPAQPRPAFIPPYLIPYI